MIGITNNATDANTKMAAIAKRSDAYSMKNYQAAPFATAASTLNSIAKQVWGDDTQPWKTGMGIFGYSGPTERIAQTGKVINPNGTSKDTGLHQFMIPRQAEVELSEIKKRVEGVNRKLTDKQRYRLYTDYVDMQVDTDKGMKGMYKVNAYSLTEQLDSYRDDKGYMQDGEFKVNVDDVRTFELWNFYEGEMQQVQLTIEQAGIMLGAMLAPISRDAE